MSRLSFIIFSAAVLSASLLFTACGSDDVRYRIGVSQCSGGSWRDKQNNEMRRELLLQEGATMEVLYADDKDEKQIADIQHFIDEKVDILLVSPINANSLSDIIGKAYDAGIPVLLFDRTVNTEKYTAFVGGDNYAVGKEMAAYTVTRLRDGGDVIEIMGDMKSSPASQRHKGFIDETRRADGIRVLASVDAGWEEKRTEHITDSLLRLYPDVDAIVTHNDFMADKAKRIADKIYPGNDYIFVGADGFGSPGIGIESVERGVLDATAIYPTGGDAIIQTAMKILKGEKYERTTLLPSYLVSTPQEAMLLISMDRALTAEAERVERMHDRATIYLRESQKERGILYVVLVVLVVICGLCIALFRMNQLRRKSNKRLYEHKNKLIEKNGQLLTMARQLEEATNAKLVFFTNISHDFRTPLNLIASPLEMIKRRLEEKGNGEKEIASLLHIAQRNVGVLLDLVNQILDFRKLENGKMDLKLQTADINALIASWQESFLPYAEKKGIRLDFRLCDGECPATVDVGKLERMVYNLIGNSIKFTPEGGTISLRCKKDDNLTITVSDTGPGIDKENLDKIFERFYQIGKNGEEGTGIGLALVKKYAELMGGRIEIESCTAEEDKGATGTSISITIPVEPATGTASAAPVSGHIAPDSLLACSDLPSVDIEEEQGVNVDETRPVALVIDDNADMRSFISTLLGGKYHVLTAVNGENGFKTAKENVPDIIICDVMMPVMDGLECCQRLKNDMCTSHIPVIMLTACSLDEQRVRGLESGAEAYLAKPFNSSVLMAHMETLLANRVRISQNIKTAGKGPSEDSTKEEKTPDNEQKLSKYDKEFLQKINDAVERNFADSEFNVETLSGIVCLSRTQLYRKCKALTGESPVELIRNTRLEHAREMLLKGETTVAAIAVAVGIPDAAYFSKCYKAYFGITPMETRD